MAVGPMFSDTGDTTLGRKRSLDRTASSASSVWLLVLGPWGDARRVKANIRNGGISCSFPEAWGRVQVWTTVLGRGDGKSEGQAFYVVTLRCYHPFYFPKD